MSMLAPLKRGWALFALANPLSDTLEQPAEKEQGRVRHICRRPLAPLALAASQPEATCLR